MTLLYYVINGARESFHRYTTNPPIFFPQGEPIKSVVFLISYWGDQIGQKVKKICDW